jgi:hypothetical protein
MSGARGGCPVWLPDRKTKEREELQGAPCAIDGARRGYPPALQPGRPRLVFHRADGQALYATWLDQQHAELRTLLKLPPIVGSTRSGIPSERALARWVPMRLLS